ncbi:hypothetical protein VTJ49DRAFT_5203 [Mycothermus thermophilus]|uniref:Core domain-containing protein n=1 Tax=Humicola insolens TaxID=85995 RepID=A0ABR3VL32_HUMIN
MNTAPLLTRHAVSAVCRSCRRSLLQKKLHHQQRHFTSTPAACGTAFQAYSLPPQPPPSARNASVPSSSIATTPIDAPLPPPSPLRTSQSKSRAAPSPSTLNVSEGEAQQSKKAFAGVEEQGTQQKQTQPTQPNPAPASASASASAQSPTPNKPATRPRSRLRARKAAITLTPAAVERLRALLDQPEPKLIKVGVRNRGCSGLAYHLEYVDGAGAFDETVEQDGVCVLIDSKALFSIIGSEMDWVEDKLSQRFVFRNPNIKEQCGCGESFMV